MGRPRLTAAISAAWAGQAPAVIFMPMPRPKKPIVEAAPPEPVRRHKLGPTLPVLQPMIDGIRHPYNKPKNGPAMADHIVALLDAVARALETDGMTLSATRLVLTARQGQNRIDLRIVERSKRVSRRGEPFRLEPTGFLYVTTDDYVAWPTGSRFERFSWEEKPGLSAKDLAKKVVADLPKLFAAEHRRQLASAERDRRWAEERAERDRARQDAAELQARQERQEALLVRVVEKASKARELRQYLAEAPHPREGEEGYGRMLACLNSRLAALEQEISAEAVEAIIRSEGFFPFRDDPEMAS